MARIKSRLKYFLFVGVFVVIGGLILCMGPNAFINKISPIVVDPMASRPQYDVSTLKDGDNLRQSSISIGITPISNKNDIPKDKLKKVGFFSDYVTIPTESHRFLVPQAKCLLDEIGKEFNIRCKQKGIRAKFIVTSLLRTKEGNKLLSIPNGNVSKNSLHRNGTTFDITYKRFWCSSQEDAAISGEILAEILTEFRRQGKCWVLREINQPCYHITVKPQYSCQ